MAAIGQFFHDLAARGTPAALATDLLLHEQADPEVARQDGATLAHVIEQAARRWNLPLAWPLMDLRLDKADLLAPLGILDMDATDRFHFKEPIDRDTREALRRGTKICCAGSVARDVALVRIQHSTNLLPIGMVIGPFSLATKLMADPITAAALLASNVAPEDEPQVRLLLDCLEAAERVVLESTRRQLAAGARAILVCEPAASTAFLSPRQIRAGATVFERLVIEPNERLSALIRQCEAALLFHNCGELTGEMVETFASRLKPALLSLGSSRKLWEDAARVPREVVLYGNLPSKSFYSDSVMPVEEVRRLAAELVAAMRQTGHPHILGTECDVLHVPEAGPTIMQKVDALMEIGV
jgi:uroporphyrinogen-III decarboxylase